LIQEYGTWIYVILFLIIFTETGLVIIPFLPGDSLLFAAGTFCAGVTTDGQHAELNIFIVLILLVIAAISGDALNYFIGKRIGSKVIRWKIGKRQLIKQKYIDQTQDYILYWDIQKTLGRVFVPDGMDIISYKILAGMTVIFGFYYKQVQIKKVFWEETRNVGIL
jgi:membrane-associated protein